MGDLAEEPVVSHVGGFGAPALRLTYRAAVPVSPLLLNSDIGLDFSRAQSVIGHRVSIRVRREGYLSGLHSFTFSSSRPEPTVRREYLGLIHLHVALQTVVSW